ncbi:ribonuclease PH [Leptolyngbya sp. FACHB-261]|uniref:ribonuclease PH n=1 Tax=Leptolyngbya sp. FACHB-261 TaxID=2692806 RepID=UPI00168815CA|nr:ribonuclease PH [Leptolyngbya sp. FACHB-261]MBD2101985.1 ribonuclease PH [Leptolyngbya sp. FACHB-261]
MASSRPDGRRLDQLRPVRFERQYTRFSSGSVLAHCGDTRVLCTVSIEETVPPFLNGTGQGWVTAEYRLLPGSTPRRQARETLKLSGRTQEIQRLIGRSLRAAIDLKALGPRTLLVDADVLQADGGTRTTAITGSYVAVVEALLGLQSQGLLTELPIRAPVAAISVGLLEGEARLDLNYPEDVAASVDLNVVMTEHQGELSLVEVQGTAEGDPFSRKDLDQMLDLATVGIKELILAQQQVLQP